jgi:hypothetical protein
MNTMSNGIEIDALVYFILFFHAVNHWILVVFSTLIQEQDTCDPSQIDQLPSPLHLCLAAITRFFKTF